MVTVVLAVGIPRCALLILLLSAKVSEFSLRIENLTRGVALLRTERAEGRGTSPGDRDAAIRDEGA